MKIFLIICVTGWAIKITLIQRRYHRSGAQGAQGPAGPTQKLQVRTVPGNLVTVPVGQIGFSRAVCADDELVTGGGTTISNPDSNQMNYPNVDFGTRPEGGVGDAPNQWHFVFVFSNARTSTTI